MRIIIKPPYWRTIYAYLFYAIVIISTLLFIRQSSIKKLKRKYDLEQERLQAKQLRLQEHKEAERLRELDMLKIKFLTNLSHEFRTRISLIMGPVDKMLDQQKNRESSSTYCLIHLSLP